MLWILPGRHQPPHRDHFALIRAALERTAPEVLYLGLIVSAPSDDPAGTELEAEARRQNDPARAPYSFDRRRRLIEAAVSDPRLRIVPLPRPEASWPLIEAMFPEE